MKQKSLNLILFFLCSLFLSVSMIGCSETEPNETLVAEPGQYLFQMPSSSATSGSPQLKGLNAYLFDENRLVKIFNDLPITENNYKLHAAPNNSVYFLSNLSDTASLQTIRVGETTLEQFLLLRSKTLTENADPQIFYSGMSKIPQHSTLGGQPLTIEMVRSVARLDLDVRNPAITVTRITVKDASSSSTIFPTAAGQLSSATEPLITFDKTFSPGITSTPAVQYLYESDQPISVDIHTLYKDISTVGHLTIPKIERNKVYNLQINQVGGELTSSLVVDPWEDAGILKPSIGDKNFGISKALSTLPEGFDIDEEKRIVHVSESGGTFTIALTSDIQIDLDYMEGSEYKIFLPFTPNKVEFVDKKVVSYYQVEVWPQDRGGAAYTATVNMKRMNETQSTYKIPFSISVDASRYQISEVTLGDVTWMGFNATSPEINDQIYVTDGHDVERMYREKWGQTIGKLFQWGRIWKYTPWLSGVSNAGNKEANSPWTAVKAMPCPAGYRVPTKEEVRALLPPGTTLPGSYTYNGEPVTATLNVSVPEDIKLGSVSGKGRYLSIKSDKTNATLFIPLAGEKGNKSTTLNPQLGAGFTLWTSVGSPSGEASVVRYWPGIDSSTYTIGEDDALATEGYAYVRCIKK